MLHYTLEISLVTQTAVNSRYMVSKAIS